MQKNQREKSVRQPEPMDGKNRFFWLKAVILFLFTAVTFIGITLYTRNLFERIELHTKQEQRAIELGGILKHFDEVLTMSVRMAVVTGDCAWQERYRNFKPQLDAVVNEATSFVPEIYESEVNEFNSAKIKIAEIEGKAFGIFRAGNPKQALELLDSLEYKKQREIYSHSIADFTKFINEQVKEHIIECRNTGWGAFTFIFVILLTLIFLCLILFQMRRNLAERKRIEAETFEWKGRYEAAVLASGHILYDWNSGTNEVIYGGAIERILGYSSEQLKGNLSKWMEIIHPEDKRYFNEAIEKIIATGKSAHFEYRVRKKDGQYIIIEDSGYFVTDADGGKARMVGFVKDITERKQTEQELENLNEELKITIEKLTRANCELADFAHIAAHDLKAPLRGIGNLAGIVLDDYDDKLDKQGKEMLSMIAGRADFMYKQINGILRYSEVGLTEEKPEIVKLNEIIGEIINSIAPPEHIQIAIVNELPALMCDRIRIVQVFQNLIDNAIKYMDKPDGHIRIACEEEGDFWKFSVSDNGRGIENKHFEKIFQIFKTFSRNDEVECTGIGLSIVKKIIETYGGKIRVESEVRKGTTFFFTFSKHKVRAANKEYQDSFC